MYMEDVYLFFILDLLWIYINSFLWIIIWPVKMRQIIT